MTPSLPPIFSLAHPHFPLRPLLSSPLLPSSPTMMMRPDFLPLLLLLSSFLGLAVSVCVPRNADPSKYLYSPAPTHAPKSSPSPPSSQKASSPVSPPPAKSSPPPPSPSPSLSGGASALKPICAYTDYPDLCMSSIQSVAPSLGSVTVQDAAGLQIKALAAKAQAAIGYAKKLMGDPQVSKDAGSCLKDCLDNYDDGMDNLDAARNALAAKDRGTINSMLSATFGSFSCSDAFSEGEDLGNCKGPSPMKDHDDVLTKLTSNSLAICEHLDF